MKFLLNSGLVSALSLHRAGARLARVRVGTDAPALGVVINLLPYSMKVLPDLLPQRDPQRYRRIGV